jgi:hypothetical protein
MGARSTPADESGDLRLHLQHERQSFQLYDSGSGCSVTVDPTL